MTGKIILDLCDRFKIWLDTKGYPFIWIDGKQVAIHVYVWEKANGNKPKGNEIHHRDFNKMNYALENLELMTHSDHQRIHKGWIRENGKWTKKPCNKCNKVLPLDQFYFIETRNIESNYCKICHNGTIKKRNLMPENIEKLRIYKRNYYRKHYGKKDYY